MTINGGTEVHLRVRVPENGIAEGTEPLMGVLLLDCCDEEFPVYVENGSCDVLEPEVIEEDGIYRGEGIPSFDLVKWKTIPSKKKIVAYNFMNLLNPDSGYEPASSVMDPAKVKEVMDGEWHDYTIHLQPNIYKVPAGHRLELYILPYLFMDTSDLDGLVFQYDESTYTDDQFEIIKEMLKDDKVNEGVKVTDRESFQQYLDIKKNEIPFGDYEPNLVIHDHKGSFVIDNASSYAVIPME